MPTARRLPIEKIRILRMHDEIEPFDCLEAFTLKWPPSPAPNSQPVQKLRSSTTTR